MDVDDPLERARLLLEEKRGREAVEALKPLIDSQRAGLLTRVAYTEALAMSGDAAEALTIARETSFMFPGAAMAAVGLGRALLAAGHLPTAIAELQRALRTEPELAEARYALGCAWLEAGEPVNALREFAAIASGHAPAAVQDKIAEAEAMQAATRSNARYVRHLFDQFSADYDSRMQTQLGYAAPQILRNLISFIMPGIGARSMRVLDLGCGTGLGGLAFADLAHTLDGIDLSPAMLAKAEARGIYSSLREGDIEAFETAGAYDLVIAADTLVYLGDLATVFSRVLQALAPQGTFLFTVEASMGDGYELGPKRRWRHSEAYLREMAARHSFEIAALVACSPRSEGGQPVPGLAAAFRKVAAESMVEHSA